MKGENKIMWPHVHCALNVNIDPTEKCLTNLELAWPGLQDETPPEKEKCILKSELDQILQGLSDNG